MTPLYAERFPVGSRIQIRARSALELFQVNWKLHHPIADEQLDWASEIVTVAEVAFYHGGDVLYVVSGRRGRSGYWHESCLEPIGAGAV